MTTDYNELTDLFSHEYVKLDHTSTIKDLTYQGFDPLEIIKEITAKAQGNDLKSDIAYLTITAIMRGADLDKIKARSTPQAVQKLNQLITKYGLKSTKTRNRTAITLPRILLCFPWFPSYFLYEKDEIPTVVSDDLLVKDYPRAMKHAAFAALIPDGCTTLTETLKSAYILHQVEFSRIIDKTKANMRYDKLSDEVERFINLGMGNTWINKLARIVHLLALGIVEETDDSTKQYPRYIVTRAVRLAEEEHFKRYGDVPTDEEEPTEKEEPKPSTSQKKDKKKK